MLSQMLRAVSPLDRFSQSAYRKAAAKAMKRAGVRVTGLPLWVSPRTFWDSPRSGLISVGNRAVISHYVKILTHDFSLDRVAESRQGELDRELSRRAPVSIGDRAFIGMGVIIMPGVSIGHGSIVGAGSVVTKDVPDGTVVAGNPARRISSTDEYWEGSLQKFEWGQRRR